MDLIENAVFGSASLSIFALAPWVPFKAPRAWFSEWLGSWDAIPINPHTTLWVTFAQGKVKNGSAKVRTGLVWIKNNSRHTQAEGMAGGAFPGELAGWVTGHCSEGRQISGSAARYRKC